MPRVKGTIKAISQKPTSFGVMINDVWYNGWGKCEWKKGQEVEFEYEEKDGFKNIKEPEKKEFKPASERSKIDEIIKYLSMPHITASVEKTIQEKQYEPKKIAIHLKVPAQNLDPVFLKNIMDLAEDEIDRRTKDIEAGKTASSTTGFADEPPPSKEEEGLSKYYEKYDKEEKEKT